MTIGTKHDESEPDCYNDCDICRYKQHGWCDYHDMPISSVLEYIQYNMKQYEQANDEYDLR